MGEKSAVVNFSSSKQINQKDGKRISNRRSPPVHTSPRSTHLHPREKWISNKAKVVRVGEMQRLLADHSGVKLTGPVLMLPNPRPLSLEVTCPREQSLRRALGSA